jgi:hypothetical protein
LDGSCTLAEFTEKIIAEIETKSLPKPRETLAKDS